MLEVHLANQYPVIVSVQTEELSYWDGVSTLHALVVVGFTDTTIFVNDPAFQAAPQVVERTEFESAWLEREYLYGLIQPTG